MKKRILSILLAFVLAFGFVSPVLAGDGTIPASKVEFRSTVGFGGPLVIETALIHVGPDFNENVTEYPSLYFLEDGTLILLRTFTADNCFCGRIGQPGPGPAFECPHINITFTEAEYLAFDFTADYVLKIPAGIYKDEADNPIGEQLVSFSGADIVEYRNAPTLIGMLYYTLMNYLYSFHEIPIFNSLFMEVDGMMRHLFHLLMIPLVRPVTAA